MRLTSPYDNHVRLNSGKHGLAAPILHSTQLAHFIPGFVKIFGLFPDFFSKQKFLFPEPCLTIPLPAALASPPLSYHPYQLPSIPFPLPYHTLCLRMTIPLPLHCHPPTSCLTIPLWHTLLSPSRTLPPLTCTLYPFSHALLHPMSMLYHSLLLYLTNSFPLPYHPLLLCLTISHSTILHNCTNKLPWQFCHLMLSKVIGHHQRSPHFLQLLCEPWTQYFLLYFG